MKKLTYAQGKLCIKLVYRECNSSSYHLIQAFLGPIRARIIRHLQASSVPASQQEVRPERR